MEPGHNASFGFIPRSGRSTHRHLGLIRLRPWDAEASQSFRTYINDQDGFEMKPGVGNGLVHYRRHGVGLCGGTVRIHAELPHKVYVVLYVGSY